MRVKKASQGVRRCGSAAIDLCLVADGTYDGYWERQLHAWDLAAGSAVPLAAGGRLTAFDGGPPRLKHGHVVGSNRRIHDQLLALATWASRAQHLAPTLWLSDDGPMGSRNEPGRGLRGKPGLPPVARSTAQLRSIRPPRLDAPSRPPASVEPAVLVVGAGAAMHAALTQALGRHGMFVESATSDTVLDAVVAAAPDLILLVGDAAKDCGSHVLAKLATSPASSVVPVVIVDDNAALEARLQAFRHGAAAVIPTSASIDAMADRVARLAREIPERAGEALGNVGEATLSDLVSALSKELRSGVLSVRGEQTPDEQAVRLVLGGGRPLAEMIDQFVARLRRHIVVAEPLHYEFDERAGGTVQLLGADSASEPRLLDAVRGLRILLADDDAARADAVAQELRARGMTVVVTDLTPTETRFARLRQVDAAVLLIGETQIQGAGYDLVRRMRKDTRLRWASLLVVRWAEIWPEGASVPALSGVLTTLGALAQPESSLVERAALGEPFDTRLEATGPARLLRALSSSPRPVRTTVHNPRAVVAVELSDELVVCATGQTVPESGETLEGAAALAALMMLSSGRVRIEPIQQATTANLMSTIDVAFNMADVEPPPIPPSLPSPFDSSLPSSPEGAMPGGALPGPPPAPTFPTSFGSKAAASSAALRRAVTRARLELGEQWRKMTRQQLAVVAALFALLVVMTLGAIVIFGGHRSKTTSSPSAEPPKASAAPPAAKPVSRALASSAAPTPPSAAPSAASSAAALLQLADHAIGEPVSHAPTCAELIHHAPRTAGRGAAAVALVHANRSMVRGDLDAAQKGYCTTLELDSKSLTAAVGLARLMLVRRDGHAAARWAKRALKIVPGDVGAGGLLGDGLALVGQYKQARAAWLSARHFDASDPNAAQNLGMQDLLIGDRSVNNRGYAQAERYYRRAAVLMPTNLQAVGSLVHTLLLENQPDAALAWARRALLLAPDSADVLVLWGEVQQKKGDLQKATAAWHKALKLDPTNSEAQRRLDDLSATE